MPYLKNLHWSLLLFTYFSSSDSIKKLWTWLSEISVNIFIFSEIIRSSTLWIFRLLSHKMCTECAEHQSLELAEQSEKHQRKVNHLNTWLDIPLCVLSALTRMAGPKKKYILFLGTLQVQLYSGVAIWTEKVFFDVNTASIYPSERWKWL